MKVVIIDDRQDTLDLAQMCLELEGIEVETVNLAREAVERIRSCRPDLVLVDFNMPELAGPELIRLVRQTPSISRTPIVVYTAMDRFVVEAAATGFDGIIRKDGNMERFVAEVRKYLEV